MSYRVPLAHYPGMNRFVLDWLAGDERFLRRGAPHPAFGHPLPAPRGEGPPPLLPLARGEGARRADEGLSPTLREALLESNKRWGIFPTIAPNALTIVAGQQVGFAGGPLYTLAKLASLIRLKRDLEKQSIPVNAYFWLATEDHDFDEVARLNVPVSALARDKEVNRQLDLVCMRAVRSTESRSVVGPQPVPEGLTAQLLSLFDIPRPAWLREGITFRDSFAELIAGICGNEVILVDALLPELRSAGEPLFAQIREREEEIQHALHERAQQLEKAGYKEQVVPRDGDRYTLLFEIAPDGTRRPSLSGNSTSALTRPLLQDSVLQPDIFLGGPAEVAYYAQLAPLHDLLGISMPRVALRGHVLVAPHRVAKAIERYGLEPCSLFRQADEILAAREPEGVARVRSIAEEAKRDLMKRIEQIGELALPADHSLADSIERSIGHIEYHFDKLAERAIKGLVRKDRERHAATRELVATLFPDRHVQDRVASWFAYHCLFGDALMERVVQEVEPDSNAFRIVTI